MGQTATLLYTLRPELLRPEGVGLKLQLDFTDADKKQWFKQPVLQKTVRIVEAPAGPINLAKVVSDWQLLGIIGTLLTIGFVVLALLASKYVSQMPFSLATATSNHRSGKAEELSEDEWVPEHIRKALKRRQVQ